MGTTGERLAKDKITKGGTQGNVCLGQTRCDTDLGVFNFTIQIIQVLFFNSCNSVQIHTKNKTILNACFNYIVLIYLYMCNYYERDIIVQKKKAAKNTLNKNALEMYYLEPVGN